MKRILMASGVALLSLLTFAPAALAQRRVVVVGGYGYGPYYGGWYGPRWYGAYGGGPYGYYRSPDSGKVKIVTQVKGDGIFVDGGYAGITGKLKKFPLRSGTHTVELRDRNGRTYYQERVEVIRGKTIEVDPDYRR